MGWHSQKSKYKNVKAEKLLSKKSLRYKKCHKNKMTGREVNG